MSTTLHIGFDAKRAFSNHTGLGNYSRNLLMALAQYYPHHQYHLYAPKAPGDKSIFQTAPFVCHFPEGMVSKRLPSLWRSFMGNRLGNDHIQLFHGLSAELPLNVQQSKAASVVTIHDLIFLEHPDLYPAIDRQIYHLKSRTACERANRIIAISEQTKQSIIQHFGTNADKISVVYQSCNPAFLEKPTDDKLATIKTRYHLPDEYILYVGSIEERKQTLQLVEAFKNVGSSTLKLVLVGNGGEYKHQVEQYIQAHQLGDRVMRLQHIPTEDLTGIYHQALALVYPSLIEGFGIPIIEALHSGTPVITTAGGCFEEAGGDAAYYVPAGNVALLTDAIREVTQSAELRQQMREKGYNHAQKFTPKAFADGVMAVYQQVL